MIPSLDNQQEYELFIYSIPTLYPQVEKSTLVFIRLGRYLAKITGEISFKADIRSKILQVVDFGRSEILRYSYTVFRDQEEIYWYDPQPHPHISALASTHPHHKHVPPDLKHNRVPAPGLSFTQPNLPFLIQEIINNLLS
ncbi:MAG: DUF6516 family protein [candidate division KSB1 bacterium]|nr:DUF6516 family protein [candidate division KSB1 bacterium]MDZ7300990.1 DUF6516 family protein [candidate division KSB1 bacterium]MDZ7310332.1 DUF6516 family protein [candidate division KSB1 bacterium]